MGKVASIVAGVALIVGGVLTGNPQLVLLGASLTITAAFSSTQNFKDSASRRTQSFRQAITSQKMILGEIKVSGPMIFYSSTNGNQFHHIVIALAGHECEKIGTVYFNDVPIYEDQLDGSGNVTSGKFSGKARIKKHLGGAGQVADSNLVSEVPEWTNNHIGAGICYLYVRIDFDASVFQNGLPNIAAVVKGAKLFDPRTSVTEWSPNSALATRHYITDTKYGRGLTVGEVDDTQFQTAANVCDEFVTTQDIAVAVNAVDTTANSLSFDEDILKYQTGDRVEISTTGTVPTGLALVTPYYVIVKKQQKVTNDKGDTVLQRPEIQLATTYANALKETQIDITGAGSGTHTITKDGEPRYTANGQIDSANAPFGVIAEILSSMGGTASYIGGAWKIKAAAWQAPTLTFDESHLAGPITLQTKISRRDRFNAVKGVFVNSHLSQGQPTDYPPVTNSTYETQDNAERLFTDLDLPFTSRSGTAQRLAKIHLEKARQEISADATFNLHGYQVVPGDTERLDNTVLGWSAKEFEVTDSKLDIGEDGEGNPLILVRQKIRETASAVFDWNSGEETVVDPAPNTNLPNPFFVEPPTSLMLASGTNQLLINTDGTIVSRILVTWTAPVDSFVERIEVQAKKNLDADWEPVPDTTLARAIISPVEDGTAYDVRVRSRNHLGIFSDWVQSIGHTVTGKTAAPGLPDSFTVEQLADGTRKFAWTHTNPDPDVRSGGGYKIRYKLGVETDWTAMTPLHEGLIVFSPWETNELAAGTYTIAIKSVDSTGNESTTPLFINTAALGNPRIGEALVQRSERVEGWPGTKTNSFVNHEGDLEAVSDGDWTDLPATWSALADTWAELLPTLDIEYTTPEIDLGLDVNFRPLVSVTTFDGTPTITAQVGTDAQGAATGTFATLGNVTARYIKIRVNLASTKGLITSMSTILDAPSKVETFEDVDTSSAGNPPWFEGVSTGHFIIKTRGGIQQITQARINAVQNVGAGYSWELISKSGTVSAGGGGFGTQLFGTTNFGDVDASAEAEFKLYDSTGTLADATVDVVLRGTKNG